MDYEPSPAFRDAASYLSKAPSLNRVSNDIKLELYGLYKWLTVSPLPNTTRPSFFDITGRAKWDAWKSAGSTFKDGAEAEKRYLQIARDLGWKEGMVVADKASEDDEEIDWDNDDIPSNFEGGAHSGLGNSVSIMAKIEDEEEDNSIHGYAVSGDVEKLNALFTQNPQLDPNEVNEYGFTALHLASDRGNIAAVKLLLSKGGDPSAKVGSVILSKSWINGM
ncbi:hypothetical protein VNI00_001675 [Paramarasmius palmivorus]|uniref:ACB domain-containing protein n=1 Tax=Paramarasmius palmivorus TaxID=297713 RepID=A0AAW0E499_9AGAR